jgi:hypothetical protein
MNDSIIKEIALNGAIIGILLLIYVWFKSFIDAIRNKSFLAAIGMVLLETIDSRYIFKNYHNKLEQKKLL